MVKLNPLLKTLFKATLSGRVILKEIPIDEQLVVSDLHKTSQQ